MKWVKENTILFWFTVRQKWKRERYIGKNIDITIIKLSEQDFHIHDTKIKFHVSAMNERYIYI